MPEKNFSHVVPVNLWIKKRVKLDFRFFFLFMHYFKSLLQKEITIHHKSNINTTLNYINIKRKMCAGAKAFGLVTATCSQLAYNVQLTSRIEQKTRIVRVHRIILQFLHKKTKNKKTIEMTINGEGREIKYSLGI